MINGNRLAIIIGVDKFIDPSIPNLPGAAYDANEMYERLHDPDIGNFKVISLIGSSATCFNIRKAISDVFWRTDSSYDLVVFYYSGHGFVDGYNNGYIASYDMSSDEPFVNGISMRELKEIIVMSKYKKM